MRAALAALFCLLVAAPVAAQDVDGFRERMRDLDPDREVILRVDHIGSKVAKVVVADGWYYLRCYQRQRFAKRLRGVWRRYGGSNLFLEDKSGTEVAAFQVLSSDFDIRGCDP